MTTSYETVQQANDDNEDSSTASAEGRVAGSAMPGRDSDGYQTWNPAVGLYHKPAKVKRESYGGIIGALQDLAVKGGNTTRYYPENFAGIIAAIQDLQVISDSPPTDIGEKPNGGDIIINPDGRPEWITGQPIPDGNLWFDTRQGRLFVSVDNEWYQTNGADGLALITEDGNPPNQEVVPGQFWWDEANQDLYIWDGTYTDTDELSIFTNEPREDLGASGYEKVWKLAGGSSDAFQTTLTLPLGNVGPRLAEDINATALPGVDPNIFKVQSDYNQWVFLALQGLDLDIENLPPPTFVGENPPPEDEREPGMLWYDTESLELSIWYVEADGTAAFVPTATAYNYDDELATVTASVQKESQAREALGSRLAAEIDQFGNVIDAHKAEVAQLIAQTNNRVKTTMFEFQKNTETADAAELRKLEQDLTAQINTVNSKIPTINHLASKNQLSSTEASLLTVINGKADKTELTAIRESIPDHSIYATKDDLTAATANHTFDYLPRSGGELTGSFTFNKQTYDQPALDFSTASSSSHIAFKLRALSGQGAAYSTFGTTNKFWEYAWDFGSHEDFCWIYNDTNKVFSITKDGPACSQLILGDFYENDSNGRVMVNKIDVRSRLQAYEKTFKKLKKDVSTATDFDSLKSVLVQALNNI